MNKELLYETVSKMMAPGKGLLAADESNTSAGKRLASVDVENTEENRRQYRNLFLTTPGVEDHLSGVIFYDETLRQSADDGTPFVDLVLQKGIVPGIKVDTGAKDFTNFPGEKITQGLDDLGDRLKEYFDMGCRFAKWRAVIKIDDEQGLPTKQCIFANSFTMARYATLCQQAGIVPVVEPEVLYDGTHTLERCGEVVSHTLEVLMYQLVHMKVDLGGVVLKSSMVLPGKNSNHEVSPEEVAEATVKAFQKSLSHELGGIVFLSGGQTPEQATANLDKIAELEPLPWQFAFSYARALQGPALDIWRGDASKVEEAQAEFKKRLKLNSLADAGEYEEYMDDE